MKNVLMNKKMSGDDPTRNGEALFFNNFVRHNASIIFDIGSKENTIFSEFGGDVHYFNPLKSVLNKICRKKTNNSRSVFNRFGISKMNGHGEFYPEYNCFIDRYKSYDTFPSDKVDRYPVKTGKSYMMENELEKVSFLKVSANGLEFEILKSFEDFLSSKVHIVQFKYGKGFYDANVKLSEVIQYLHSQGFYNFSYLRPTGLQDVIDLRDTYEECNIVCLNKNFK